MSRMRRIGVRSQAWLGRFRPFGNVRGGSGRLGLAYAVLCLLGASLLDCGGDASTPESVTITFSHGRDEGDHYQALVQEFNRSHPHIWASWARKLEPLSD